MRITKFIHSCILLEENGHKLLFDPGKFSFIEGRVKPEDFGDVGTIVISHEHPDHVDIDALKQIIRQGMAKVSPPVAQRAVQSNRKLVDQADMNKVDGTSNDSGWFSYAPQVRVFGNEQVVAKLQNEGISATTLAAGPQQIDGFTIEAVAARHEAILAGELPQNTAHIVNGRILNPGDSFNPSLEVFAGIELLLLPVMAPWLTELAALDFARRLRPKQALPIHDGYARDFFLKQRYETYASVFANHDIKFHPLMEPGASITL